MKKQPNRWRGFVLGLIGSIAGLGAMGLYWKRAAPWVSEKLNDSSRAKSEGQPRFPMDDISIFGPKYEEGETSTDALGRIMHEAITGKPPRSKEGLKILSYLVHYVYGMVQGGIYGMCRAQVPSRIDLIGGCIFGTSLWLLGDEIVVPLLGLQQGPTSISMADHLNRWGAHLSYGCSTALTTQFLNRFL